MASLVNSKNKKRMIGVFVAMGALVFLLCLRLGYWQIIKSAEMTKQAITNQTKDISVDAERGVIYDCNGTELAISGAAYTVSATPADVANGGQTGKISSADKSANVESAVKKLSVILDIEEDTLREKLTEKSSSVRLAKYLNKETADKIAKAKIPGIVLVEGTKRYYPLGSFASQLLGSVNDDGEGQTGLEQEYESDLGGVPGKWVTNTDTAGNTLSYGTDEYFEAQDGVNLVLTIDSVIQNYVENAIDSGMEDTSADRIMCVAMDPETGEILAMAVTPDFDPNNPRIPTDAKEAKKVEKMSPGKQLEYWSKMWRNPIVSDTYEPGSTFKLITTSSALEEGVTNLKEKFTCTGSIKVADVTLHCWRRGNPHGTEDLTQAVGNSCNPVFVQLGQRVGKEKFYNYLDAFGITEKTGIDYPSEATAQVQNEETSGIVELSTMAYGQGIAVTPIQLITAVSAIGNDGKLMKPMLVKEITDKNGHTIESFKPEVVRQAISEDTASKVCTIMKYVVEKGGAGTAKVSGYSIGGKTGTANKASNGGYSSETYSSFIGMAPMDDPQIAVLVIVDNPKGVKYGSVTAAPIAKDIFENVLKYMKVDTTGKKNSSGKVKVPDVVGENLSDAAGILGGKNLEYKVGSGNEEKDFEVKNQYPKAGTVVKAGSKIYVYAD